MQGSKLNEKIWVAQWRLNESVQKTIIIKYLIIESMGKVHGSLARNGKVRNQAPKVAKAERVHKLITGRSKKRNQYK